MDCGWEWRSENGASVQGGGGGKSALKCQAETLGEYSGNLSSSHRRHRAYFFTAVGKRHKVDEPAVDCREAFQSIRTVEQHAQWSFLACSGCGAVEDVDVCRRGVIQYVVRRQYDDGVHVAVCWAHAHPNDVPLFRSHDSNVSDGGNAVMASMSKSSSGISCLAGIGSGCVIRNN